MNPENAIRALVRVSKEMPCPHVTHNEAGLYGVKCEDCGRTVSHESLERSMSSAMQFELDIEYIREYMISCEERINELTNSLQSIAFPIRYMESQLQEGERLNGAATVQLSNDPEYLKGLAKDVLK